MSRRVSRTFLLAAVTALVAVAAAAPAEAAKRKTPFGFFGVTLIGELTTPRDFPDAQLEQQFALMASSGVESIRITFGWAQIEPARGTYNWAAMDRIVAAAARHRIAVMANFSASTRWASTNPTSPDYWRYPPSKPQDFAAFFREGVRRYGPKGTFWAENPGTPRVPIRKWQVWNEQMAPWFWVPRPWAPSYVKLLKASYKAIHKADPKAKVIAGSLMSYGNYHQWDGVRDMYKRGAKRYFDAIAVHPFTNDESARVTANQTLEIVKRVRTVMNRHKDKRKPIEVTEMTWAAARGKVPANAIFGMETTAKGQAARLKTNYTKLARYRRKMRLAGVYWFTWATDYQSGGNPSSMSFRFSGLVRYDRGVFSPLPVLGTFSRLAARYEGCRKSSSARRCR
ncbi:MAG: beta-galactosidase [Thermoleophilaceae bacterium]|nr:beta-galactosidase [Thermoleophilaceae bacterium]